jgi:hypothetical protein
MDAPGRCESAGVGSSYAASQSDNAAAAEGAR